MGLMQTASIVVRRVGACLGFVALSCAAAPPAQSPGSTPSPTPAPAPAAQSPAAESEPVRLPTLPSPTLAAPAGNRLAFALDATGVQIYTCQAKDAGFAWTFQAPEAALVDRRGQVVVKHYAGPTWESVEDGSKVVASKLESFADDQAAIPKLLLKASQHDGNGRMSDVTYIQRLATSRGLSPASGCDATRLGAVERVEYTATYYFYRAEQGS